MHASQFALILPIPPLRANMGGGLEDAEYPINKNELGPNSSLPRKPDWPRPINNYGAYHSPACENLAENEGGPRILWWYSI